ncbi:hypothetical protein HPP92_019791 [Vanilla planifolia]|uniref:Dof zinc finger protein n=1 Tax=Vanilla planifolia TaxID=51239 RepID=A0A835Q9H0_VANPL|nr:hypothetical protein HPP92_019791 [Vanilla planifolia]
MEISNGHQALAGLSPEEEKKPRRRPEQPLRCPRCDSPNTKFCYYNNYSLSQPRYFCKGCRRYWTKGGSLRNVPVGGGCRKSKRASSSSSSSTSTSSSSTKNSQAAHNQQNNFPTRCSSSRCNSSISTSLVLPAMPLPPLYEPSDLTLSFPSLQSDAFLLGNHSPNPNTHAPGPTAPPFLDILRSEPVESTNLSLPAFGFHGYYELGDQTGFLLPFDGVTVGNGTVATGTVMGNGTTKINGHDSGTGLRNFGVESARDYWNSVGSSSWPGLINSSQM